MARAFAKSVRISPRKAQLLASALRGKRVDEALSILKFAPQGAAGPLAKVIASAAANATNNEKLAADGLVITELRADAGPRLKRFRPVSRGRAHPYQRPTAHLTAVVTGVAAKSTKPRKTEAEPKPRPEPAASAPNEETKE